MPVKVTIVTDPPRGRSTKVRITALVQPPVVPTTVEATIVSTWDAKVLKYEAMSVSDRGVVEKKTGKVTWTAPLEVNVEKTFTYKLKEGVGSGKTKITASITTDEHGDDVDEIKHEL